MAPLVKSIESIYQEQYDELNEQLKIDPAPKEIDLEIMSSNMYNLELCHNLFRTLQFRTMLSPYRHICGEKGFFLYLKNVPIPKQNLKFGRRASIFTQGSQRAFKFKFTAKFMLLMWPSWA